MRCVETTGISGNYRLSGIRDKQIRLRQCLVSSNIFLSAWIYRSELPPEAFATMDVYFNKLRQLGKKALLRFAYETEPMGTVSSGSHNGRYVSPYETIETSRENKDVILALQAGFIGAWGRMAQFQTLISKSSDANKRIIPEKDLPDDPSRS